MFTAFSARRSPEPKRRCVCKSFATPPAAASALRVGRPSVHAAYLVRGEEPALCATMITAVGASSCKGTGMCPLIHSFSLSLSHDLTSPLRAPPPRCLSARGRAPSRKDAACVSPSRRHHRIFSSCWPSCAYLAREINLLYYAPPSSPRSELRVVNELGMCPLPPLSLPLSLRPSFLSPVRVAAAACTPHYLSYARARKIARAVRACTVHPSCVPRFPCTCTHHT
jgi:hypothetical protein